MRYTPHALIAVGIALILYALWSVSAAAEADGMQASQNHTARVLIQNMPAEDIRRVFNIPPQVPDSGDWLQHSLGQSFSAWVAHYISANIFILGILGVTQVVWGVRERVSRNRTTAPSARPADPV
jgi:hypothetical protein